MYSYSTRTVQCTVLYSTVEFPPIDRPSVWRLDESDEARRRQRQLHWTYSKRLCYSTRYQVRTVASSFVSSLFLLVLVPNIFNLYATTVLYCTVPVRHGTGNWQLALLSSNPYLLPKRYLWSMIYGLWYQLNQIDNTLYGFLNLFSVGGKMEDESSASSYEQSRPHESNHNSSPRSNNGTHRRSEGPRNDRSKRGYATEDNYRPSRGNRGDSSYGQIGYHVTRFYL